MPSPLGAYANGNNSSRTLSVFSSFTSTSASSTKGTSPSPVPGSTVVSMDNKTPSQVRVRHLEQDSSYAGYLTKYSSRTFFSRKQWKRRYFILHQDSLHCFKSSDPQHPLLESIDLCANTIICVTDVFQGKRYCLQITSPSEKNWFVLADTATEMSGWLRELKGAVLHCRTPQPQPHLDPHSSMNDFTDLSSVSLSKAIKVPSVPTIPSQFEYHSSTRSVTSTSSLSSSPPTRPTNPSLTYDRNASLSDIYQGQVTSLSPPPRAHTPKPSTPTPGSGPARTPAPETRRRRNSSLSAGQPAPDYASIGSVMQRAEEQGTTWNPALMDPSKTFATVPRSKRESSMSTLNGFSTSPAGNNLSNYSSFNSSNGSANGNNRSGGASRPVSQRMSVLVDYPESNILLPRRNTQRLIGVPARSMSPLPSRSQSPTFNRPSPRSSLVVSPPPRSIHRPASVAIRHSTLINIPLQNTNSNLASTTSPLSSKPPTSSLPAPPESTDQTSQAPLPRITSIRHPRDFPNRQSMINTSGSGSFQERVQRSPSRISVLRGTPSPNGSSPNHGSGSGSGTSLYSYRPTSPIPSITSAPTQPLPEPPRSGSTSPSQSPSTQPSGNSSSVPQHHGPDLIIPTRSKARQRSQSQESAAISTHLGELSKARKPTTPSPRLSAIMTRGPAEVARTRTEDRGRTPTNRQMSLPIQSFYALPAPPTGEQPAQPSTPGVSRSMSQRPLRPMSSVSTALPLLGGAVARRTPNRDSIVSARLSTLISLPPEPTTAVPPPPLSAPPTTALPSKPVVRKGSSPSMDLALNGFAAIKEEEEEEEEDEAEEEIDLGNLSIVDQEAADAESARPEYYATKESKVVEYIFPSESLTA